MKNRDLNLLCTLAVTALVVLPPDSACADGLAINRIYDPYVQPLETELEWRTVIQSDDTLRDQQKHYFGFGRSLTDRWAVELYAIGTDSSDQGLNVDAYELEFTWQLTEQGEYAFDWGLLFELERETDVNGWEFATGLLSSREFGRWTGTANLKLIYEWGRRVIDEIETELHLQARYRLQESLEPVFELHMGQDTIAIGPALTGLVRISAGKKFRWELGIFAGLDDKSPDQTIKANIEFEF